MVKKKSKKNALKHQSPQSQNKSKPFLAQKSKGKNNLILNLVFIILIVAAGLILYWGTTDFNFVYCDDNIFVIDYQKYNSDASNIFSSFEKTVGATYYRPILASSFVIDCQRGGIEPKAYRITNVILHISSCALLFIFFIMLGFNLIESFLTSLLFTVHPLLTPAAAWLSGRNDSLIAIFILLSFITLIIFRQKSGFIKWISFTFHLMALALSLYTKEIAIMLPIIAAIYIYLKDKKIITSDNLVLIIGWGIIGLIWFAMRQSALRHIQSPDTIGLDALLLSYPTIFALLGKIFIPYKLAPLSTFETFSIISGVAVLLGIVILSILKKLPVRRLLFGALWFLLFLVPTLLIRIIYVEDFFDYVEHRAYLPMIGIFIIILEIFKILRINFREILPIVILLIVTGVFFARSFTYRSVFEDRIAFWRHFVEMYPYKARGYLDLGKSYYVNQEFDKAAELYKQGIKLNPKNCNLYIDLTAVYLVRQQYDSAIYYGKKAVALDPTNQLANYNLGKSFLSRQRYSEAVHHLEIAVRNSYKFPDWLIDLGVAYYHSKRYDDAIRAYKNSIARSPNNWLCYSNLGTAYAQIQDYQNAEMAYKKAIEINPKFQEPYNNLIQLYQVTGQNEKAVQTINLLKMNGGVQQAKLVEPVGKGN